MKPLTLGQIAHMTAGELIPSDTENIYARGVATDSRTISPGELFFAIKSERDGHLFAGDAEAGGAIALVVSHKTNVAIPQIVVPDTLQALGDMAMNYRSEFDIPVVAVTGSVGKTTVREMIHAALSPRYNTLSAKNNYNNLIGLPLTLMRIDDNIDAAVVELGINQFHEMERLIEISQPTLGIITAIAPVHLEGLGSIENIATEKTRLFSYLSKKEAPMFFNADDDILQKRAQKYTRAIGFGFSENAVLRGENLTVHDDGTTSFSVDGLKIHITLLGKHNTINALGAYAVARSLDVAPDEIKEALGRCKNIHGRMERLIIGKLTIIADTYNANPTSTKAAIRSAVELNSPPYIAVLGDMLELGENAVQYHIDILKYALKLHFDRIFTFGSLFGAAAKAIASPQIIPFDNINRLIKIFLKQLTENGIILVKGSRGMRMERVVDSIKRNIE